ncbi:hypothetical protein SCLCIDRAFT_1220418, partial [Scleroderma citrinum Foug A]
MIQPYPLIAGYYRAVLPAAVTLRTPLVGLGQKISVQSKDAVLGERTTHPIVDNMRIPSETRYEGCNLLPLLVPTTVDSLITHTPCDMNTSSPVGIGQRYIVYEITSKYGAIRWPTSYNNMCGRQKDMLAFMGMGYKGVDCSRNSTWTSAFLI